MAKLGVRELFFEELREGSRVKHQIVTSYFVAYNNVMTRTQQAKIGYADLFAGPGLYRTQGGQAIKSIPLLICERVVADKRFQDKVHLWFNDGNPSYATELGKAIKAVQGIDSLRFSPKVSNRVVDASWCPKLERLSVPTLVFLDPFGYKGLSLRLVTAAIKRHGNDCIFFFNYSRINMKLSLELMKDSIDDFFEPERANALRAELENREPPEREELILTSVKSAIENAGAFPLTFRFKSDNGRTSHHLVYASKNQRAAGMMKSILKTASSEIVEGVGSSQYDPHGGEAPGNMFAGLYQVADRLLSVFAGRKIQFELLLSEEAGTHFTESNYRDALLDLESTGRVHVEPSAELRRLQPGGQKRTLPKGVWLTFPSGDQDGQ